MNKSERKAYEWLKKKGYKKIVFYDSRTPDFDTEEECFEVKRGYKLKTGEIKIIFELGQREKIKDKGGKVLVFIDDDEPLDILNPDEIMESRVRDIILHDACSELSAPIRVSPVTRDKLRSIGAKGETYDDIINALLNR